MTVVTVKARTAQKHGLCTGWSVLPCSIKKYQKPVVQAALVGNTDWLNEWKNHDTNIQQRLIQINTLQSQHLGALYSLRQARLVLQSRKSDCL